MKKINQKVIMTIKEAFNYSFKRLRGSVSDWRSDSYIFLENVLGLSFSELNANLGRKLSEEEINKLDCFIDRRLKNEPTSQIVGSVDFLGLNLKVNRSVLTPRPETEILVERAIEEILKIDSRNLKILDIGTGSGAIICSLANSIDCGNFFASDISEEALEIARENANNLGLKEKITFKKGDLFIPWKGMSFDIVLANLPYIPLGRRKDLDKNVVDFEPEIALFAGEDGLRDYRNFFKELPRHLNDSGMVFCEIDETQGESIKEIALKYFKNCQIEIIQDIYGFDRIAIIKL